LCYGILLKLAEDFNDNLVISICPSDNIAFIYHNLELINFKGVVYIDSADLFLNNNATELKANNIFLIDSAFRIVARKSNIEVFRDQ